MEWISAAGAGKMADVLRRGDDEAGGGGVRYGDGAGD